MMANCKQTSDGRTHLYLSASSSSCGASYSASCSMLQQHHDINVSIYLKGCLAKFVFGLLVCPPVQKNTGTAFLISQRRLTYSEKALSQLWLLDVAFISSTLPCCTRQKCEVQCSLRRFEKRCLPHKRANVPDVGQSPAGTPF